MQSHSHYKMPCVTPSLAEKMLPTNSSCREEKPCSDEPLSATGSELRYHTTPWLLLHGAALPEELLLCVTSKNELCELPLAVASAQGTLTVQPEGVPEPLTLCRAGIEVTQSRNYFLLSP